MRKNRVEKNNIKLNFLKKHINKTNNPNTLTMKSLKTTLTIAIFGLFTSNLAFSQNTVRTADQLSVSYDELNEEKKAVYGSEEAYLAACQPIKAEPKKDITKKQNITPVEDPSLKEQEIAKANQKAEEKARITAEEERKATEKADIQKSQANASIEKQVPLSPDYIRQLLAHKHHGTDGIDGKIDKLIAEGALSTDWEVENRHLAPIYLTLPQIITAYENNTEGIEETINELLSSGKLSIDILNENNVDINSKLYKKLNDHQKIGK